MSTAKVFDRLSDRYDMWYVKNRVTAANELKLVKKVITDKPSPCIEVGVGTGYFASTTGCRLGLDPSPSMLSKALSRGIDVIAGIGESLPIRSSSIGTIVLVVTLCFLDYPSLALREAHRVLRPDGFLILCIVPRDSPWGRYYVRLSKKGHPFYRAARFYRVSDVLNMTMPLGFKHIRTLGVLRYRPWNRPRPEPPRDFRGDEGFVCMEFQKRG